MWPIKIIHRGKLIGIKCKLYNGGEVMVVQNVALLGVNAESVIWGLIQQHQYDNPKDLLSYLQVKVDFVHRLNIERLSFLISK